MSNINKFMTASHRAADYLSPKCYRARLLMYTLILSIKNKIINLVQYQKFDSSEVMPSKFTDCDSIFKILQFKSKIYVFTVIFQRSWYFQMFLNMVNECKNKCFNFLAVCIWNFASLRLFNTESRIGEWFRSGDINAKDDHGRSSLYLAAERGTFHLGDFCVILFTI